jgi:hypothetical protein
MGRKRSFGLLGSNVAGQSPNKKIAISLAPKGVSGPESPKSTSPITATPTSTPVTPTATAIAATTATEPEQKNEEKKE